MIYIFCFILSVCISYIAERKLERLQSAFFLFVISASLPIILAGLRDVSVGIDVTWYVTPPFYAAQKYSSLSSFMKYMAEDDAGFFIYVYIITKLFDSLIVLMTLNHLIIITPILYILYYYKKNNPMFSITLGYAIWLLSIYNMTLCVVRQSMALGFGLLAIVFLFRKKYLLCGVMAFLSYEFHHSMILFLSIIILLYLVRIKISSRKKYELIASIICFSSFIGTFLINHFLGFVNEKYAERVEDSLINEGGRPTAVFWFILALLPFYFVYRRKVNIHTDTLLYFFPLIGAVFFVLGLHAMYIGRLAYPFLTLTAITIPCLPLKRSSRTIILGLFVLYWIVQYPIHNSWETVPYIFTSF